MLELAEKQELNSSKKVIAATTLGNALEMYDFTVFSFFSTIIGKLFFPVSDDPLIPWLLALATFGIGFFMRPLGSIIIGNYADKYGRKPALTLTIFLMALSTGMIAFAPTYASVGLFAPVIILTARLIQGFSAGGEIGSATSFLMESGAVNRRGFMVSWQMMGQGISAFLGALTGALLYHQLPVDALESWGWRLPFIAGILIAPIGVYIRRHLNETLPEKPLKKTIESHTFKQILKKYPMQLILGISMILSTTTVMYIIVFYLPIYAIKMLHMPASTSYLTSCITGIILMIFSPIFGKFTDYFHNRKILYFTCVFAQAVTVVPFFIILNQNTSFYILLTGASLMMFFASINTSAYFLLVMESFPPHLRATGIGVIYAVGVALFGGFAQFNVTWLMDLTGSLITPGYYTMICCILSLIAAYFFPNKKRY